MPSLGAALLLSLSALLPATRLSAQRTLHSAGEDFRNAGADILHIWTAPFHATSRDWGGAAIATGLTLLALPFDDNVDRWMVSNRESAAVNALRPFREDGKFTIVDLGTSRRIQPIAGAVYIIGFAANSRTLRDGALGCAAMQASNSVLRRFVLYPLIARPRPDSAQALGVDQYDVSVPGKGWGYRSFPAGHFMNAMGCASFLAHRFEMGLVEPVLYAAAIGIGVGRIADRRHWTSDTVVGLAMGYAIGRTIAARQLKRLAPAAAVGGGASLGAMTEQGETRYVIGWSRRF